VNAPHDMAGENAMFERARSVSQHLPGLEVANYHHFQALKVNGKLVANICREPGALAVHCPLELKQQLLEAAPDVFYDTAHFAGWPSILVRMDAVDDETLRSRIEAAWQMRAPKALVKQWTKGEVGNGSL
jgi:hypothetical protein